MSSRPDLRLNWCGYQAAEYAVRHWHYSQSMPTPPRVQVGVWEDDAFVGVVVFSRGAVQNIGRPFGLAQTAVAELTRVALRRHRTPVSRILRVAVQLLQRRCPGLALLVSFADPGHDHVGGIYQASNWFYLGRQAETVEFVAPDGKQWHGRMVSKTGMKKVYGVYRKVLRTDQCTPVERCGKHRYIMPLDAAMRDKVSSLSKPYPIHSLPIEVQL